MGVYGEVWGSMLCRVEWSVKSIYVSGKMTMEEAAERQAVWVHSRWDARLCERLRERH